MRLSDDKVFLFNRVDNICRSNLLVAINLLDRRIMGDLVLSNGKEGRWAFISRVIAQFIY